MLKLLLADSALTVGRGKTFWRVGQVIFAKMAITREQKVENVPKMGNKQSLRGLQAIDQNWGRLAKTEISGPKKTPTSLL